MTQELRIGPMDPTARVDPRDPDVAGALTGRYGVHNNALRLIEANAAAYADMTPALALTRDDLRTEALREDTTELEEVLDLPDGYALLSADVRGTKEGNQIVTYLIQAPSGRSARGRFGYGELTETEARYRDSLSRGLVRAAPADPEAEEDPRVAALQEENARLRKEREEAAAALAAGAVPTITHPDGSSSVPSGYPPAPAPPDPEGSVEPVPGYDAMNTEQAEARYTEETDDAVKASILRYELAHKARAWAKRANGE